MKKPTSINNHLVDTPGPELKHMPFDLVCFCHLRWKFVFQRPQHLMIRWAKERRVFFVEEPVMDEGNERLQVERCEKSGVYIVTPYLSSAFSVNERNQKLQTMVEKLLAHYQIHTFVSLYYTPMSLAFTQDLPAKIVVYDCMDELSHFKGASPELKIREREMFDLADLVFTGGYSLYEYKRPCHHNIHPFPSSVDTAHFSQARELKTEPADQAEIPHPRLGFYGVIDERFDLELLKGMAEQRPDWHFVLVGPIVKIEPEVLPHASNIHYLGPKTYEELPHYLAGWDVALLLFARNDATRFISPTKTPEYMAGGKPVVSTSITDVVRPYGEKKLVRIADTVDDFIAAIQAALNEDRIKAQKDADAFLAQMSWDQTWLRMKRLIYTSMPDVSPVSKVEPAIDLETGGFIPFDRPVNNVKDTYDFLVVGAGFAGAVVAERLARVFKKKVLVCDRRGHIGGNAYDCPDEAGVLIHKYGPHIFHTNSADVYNYLSHFTEWRPYEHRVLSSVDGKLLPIPINLDTINKYYGWDLNSAQLEEFFQRVGEPRAVIKTSEDVIISKVGRELYEKFFRHYTRKQWGLDPSELDSTVIARIPVRTNRDDRYFTDTYQAMPKHGFTALFRNMLSHPKITLKLGVDYREIVNYVSFKEMVYSGPIDSFFDYKFGKLPYRSLKFRHETHDMETFQPVAVVNYPNDYDYTRITEFKYLSGQRHPKTSVVYEYPQAEGDAYYPIPRPDNYEQYLKYHILAEATPHVHFSGRLATYKYYNMDQVVAQSLTLASKIGGVARKKLLESTR